MVSERTAYGVIYTSMPYGRNKFGENETLWCLFNMFSKGPPAIVVDFLKRLIRAFEERNIINHPLPAFRVRNEIYNIFGITLIK
jgi:hypothetical protein